MKRSPERRTPQQYSIGDDVFEVPSAPRSKRLRPPPQVSPPGARQDFTVPEMTSGLVYLNARMDAIEAWAGTVSETVSANNVRIDQKIVELLEAIRNRATIGSIKEVDEQIGAEARER